MVVDPIVSFRDPQQLADTVEETRVPVNPWKRSAVRKNMKSSAHNIGLGHTLPNAKRAAITTLQVNPSIQRFARFQKNCVGTFLVEFLEDHVSVAAPLINEAVFVLF